MEEVLLFILQAVCEAILHVISAIFVEGYSVICSVSQHQVEIREQDKKRQEYEAAQPKWSLLRAAEIPSASGEELLRPASGGNVAEQTELLRADPSS